MSELKISGPELHNNDEDYADVCTYVSLEGGDWKFTLSLAKDTGTIYKGPVQFAKPEDCFEETKEIPPEIVVDVYSNILARATEMLKELE